MQIYKWGPGHDLAPEELVTITPTPSGTPVAPVERNYAASGAVHSQGKYLILHWDFIDSPAEYLALLAQIGLDEADSVEVTVQARSERLVETYYNGVAMLPEPGADFDWENFFQRGLNMYIVSLEEIE